MQVDVVSPLNINLDPVPVGREAVKDVFTCVQDFVRDPLFTQKSSFSNSDVAMLKETVGGC